MPTGEARTRWSAVALTWSAAVLLATGCGDGTNPDGAAGDVEAHDETMTLPAPVADPNGSTAEQAAWAVGQISADLEAMNEAFAADDRGVWIDRLAAGEAVSLSADADDLQRQVGLYYDNMQVMAAELEWRLLGEPVPSTVKEHSFEAPVGLRYCLAPTDPADCVYAEVDYLASWDLVPDAAELDLGMSALHSRGSAYRPVPWEVAPLKVAVRDRILVAATTDSPHDPRDYIEAAQAAAAAADQFAVSPVASYPVFLASADQFTTWYGGPGHAEALGYAAYTLTDTTEAATIAALHLVIAADRTNAAGAAWTIKHEAVHVATLQGAAVTAGANEKTWWLMEGIAEYGAAGATMPAHRVSDTAAYIGDGGCADGAIPAPATTAAAVEHSGSYGCAYLGVRALIEAHGQEAFLAFFTAAHNRGEELEAAAQTHLGVSYAEVLREVAAAIASAV